MGCRYRILFLFFFYFLVCADTDSEAWLYHPCFLCIISLLLLLLLLVVVVFRFLPFPMVKVDELVKSSGSRHNPQVPCPRLSISLSLSPSFCLSSAFSQPHISALQPFSLFIDSFYSLSFLPSLDKPTRTKMCKKQLIKKRYWPQFRNKPIEFVVSFVSFFLSFWRAWNSILLTQLITHNSRRSTTWNSDKQYVEFEIGKPKKKKKIMYEFH